VKITVRCGVLNGGKPCGRRLEPQIEREDLNFAKGIVTFDPLRWQERFYDCPKHGAMQVHDEDLLRLALNPSPPVIMTRSVRRMGDP
jgi:hypothetical protein